MLLVNLSVPFARACGNVPVLRELARAVAWSPSLSAAVENDYVQPIGQSQTVNGITATVEYVIVDQKQVNIFFTLKGEGYETLSADLPEFTPRQHCAGMGADPSQPPGTLLRFSLDYQDYCGQGKMVVIANPNAPTGLSIPVEAVEQIAASNPDNVVVIDEAYVDFGGETALPLIEKYDNLLVTRTFSKSRCMAGGRLGYAFGSAALIADLEKIKYSTNPYNLDRLTLKLGEATVDAEDYYQKMCTRIQETRDWTKEQLESLGFQVLPSQTNFLFARTDRMDGQELYLALKARGILVRHFSNPRIDQFNRITIGTPEQMETFLTVTKEILGL